MKIITLLLVGSLLLCGCARKSELEAARENLAEAQRKIEILERERVARSSYDATRASLRLAEERIAELERGLKLAQEQVAVQAATQSTQNPTPGSAQPTALGLTKGTYEVANATHVYSADAELNLGSNLKVTSPNGLMVSDPEIKVVGGDLSIKAKDVQLDAPDAMLTTAADGSVKFTGKTLTMRFEDGKKSEAPQAADMNQAGERDATTSPNSPPPPATTEGGAVAAP
jgi:selenocysteine-specific translation elongation factor